MERFQELLRQGGSPVPDDRKMLEDVAAEFPWFIPGKILLISLYRSMGEHEKCVKLVNSLGLRPVFYPAPAALGKKVNYEEFLRPATMDVISEFLTKDNLKIVADVKPDNAVPDLSDASAKDPGDEIISEKLAEIYLAQGMTDKAKTIYSKLSLKFPEKSIYFAEIIDKIDKENKEI